jgi:hypothetical protein
MTIISKKTSTLPTETTTPIETSTILDVSTTIEYEEITTTTTATVNNKTYEFQSNFSRNNDSVFVSLHSNVSDSYVSISNTFIGSKYDTCPCEILFNEHAHKIIETKILINFNGTLTRDLAIQFGDRLIDMADLLSTVRSMLHQNNTIETV